MVIELDIDAITFRKIERLAEERGETVSDCISNFFASEVSTPSIDTKRRKH